MAEPWVLGIEIGGTKLQLGIGQGQGSVVALERLLVDPSRGAAGILDQIQAAFPTLLEKRESLQATDRRRRHRLRRTGRRLARTDPKILPGIGLGRFPAHSLDRASIWVSRSSSSKTTRTPPGWPRPGLVRASAIRRSCI